MVEDIPPPQTPSPAPDGTVEPPQVDEARAALVQRYLKEMQDAEAYHAEAFKEMRDNQYFAAMGAEKKWVKAKKYRVPIIARHINQEVATLYARNPRVVAKRKRKLMYRLWDGRSDSLQFALDQAAAGDPQAIELLTEVATVRRFEKMLDRMGKTIEVLWTYFLNEQSANYKQQIKALVRRAKVCKVAYIKLGYQRIMESRPEIVAKIDDTTGKIDALQCLMEKAASGEIQEHEAGMEELRLLLKDLQEQKDIIVREGPVLDFPRSTTVLIDPECVHVKSLAGARFIAFIYDLDPDEIYKTYKVKIGDPQPVDGSVAGRRMSQRGSKPKKHRVYEIWDKRVQQTLTICEGWPDFLKEPASPDAPLERFWPLFPLVFNEIESEEMMFPPSDVEQAKHIQEEYNRSREGLRQHRIAARPYYVEGGRLSDEDKALLSNHEEHEVLTIGALAANEKIDSLLQRGPTVNIDPNLYEVEMHFSDMLRVLGTQEANLGGTSDGTATEASIAENSRSKTDSSNVDDLDEMLGELSRSAAEMLFMQMSKDSVIEIVGDGAVWPDMPQTREEAAKELSLDIVAGSSGRPNEAAEMAKLERATPLLLQLQGVQSTPIGRRIAEFIGIDPEELIADGNPSITAINAVISKAGAGAPQPGTGDPASDPNQQGMQGANNAPAPQQPAPGGQPAYPGVQSGTAPAGLTPM